MGGSMGNPIDEAAQARINQKIEDVVKYFGIEFSKAYTQACIQKIKDEIQAEPGLEDKLKLQDPPVATAILKSGILIKVSWLLLKFAFEHCCNCISCFVAW